MKLVGYHHIRCSNVEVLCMVGCFNIVVATVVAIVIVCHHKLPIGYLFQLLWSLIIIVLILSCTITVAIATIATIAIHTTTTTATTTVT